MSGISDYLSFRFRALYPEVVVRSVTEVTLCRAHHWSADQLKEIADEVLAAEQRRRHTVRPLEDRKPLPHLSPGQTWVLPSGAWRTVTSVADPVIGYYDDSLEDCFGTLDDFRRWALRG